MYESSVAYIRESASNFITMRLFNVRHSCLVFSDNNLRLYLQLDHTTIYIQLNPTIRNIRIGHRIRAAMLEEKIILRMSGINEYRGRLALLR